MRVNASCTAVLLHIFSGKYARMVKAIDDFAGVQHTDSDAVYKCCRSEETRVRKCNNNNNNCLRVQTFH